MSDRELHKISDEGEDSPVGVRQLDINAVRHVEGRDELNIYPPLILGHYAQSLAAEFANFAREVMVGKGIDETVANSVASRFATLGLRHFVNMAEFGYAERVLEERAGLDPLQASPQPIEQSIPNK